MKERSITGILQLLLQRFGASDFLSGTLIGALPAAMTMLLGPIISYRSDRHRGKWGRRIPFLLFTVPVAVVSMVGLAFSPALGTFLHKGLGSYGLDLNGSVLIWLGIFWTLFESASVTTNALFGGLVNDVVPPQILGRFYSVFRAFGLMAGIIFGYWLLQKAERNYLSLFLGLAALYAVGFGLMCCKVKEGPYEGPPLPNSRQEDVPSNAAKTYIAECFGHSYYVWFYAAFALSTMVGTPVNLFSVFLARNLHMDMGDYGKSIALTYIISLVLSYPLGVLADRFHPLRTGIVALILYAGVTWLGWWFGLNAWAFRIAFIAHGVICGSWLTLTASLGQRLLPHAKFAQFNSAAGIIVSLGTMIVGPLLGIVLDHAHHAYRHIFLASFSLTVLALAASFILEAKFTALGGPEHYVAPDSD